VATYRTIVNKAVLRDNAVDKFATFSALKFTFSATKNCNTHKTETGSSNKDVYTPLPQKNLLSFAPMTSTEHF